MSEQASYSPPTHTGMGDTLERILREVEAEGAPNSATDAGSAPVAEAVPSASGGGTPPLGALLGGMMSNPALLSAIPTLVDSLGPLLGGGSGHGGGGGGSKSLHHSLDRHTALLCAVKPYLGRERQEAAEKIIRLCRAWDALQKSGMPDLLRGLAPALTHDTGEAKGNGGVDGHVQ